MRFAVYLKEVENSAKIIQLSWLMELAYMMPDVACDAVLNLILLAIRTSGDSDEELLCCSLVNSLLSKRKPFTWFKRLITRYFSC